MVAGYAVGGGHILHMVADITVSIALSPAALSFTAAGHNPLPMATQLDVIILANLQKQKRLFTVSG